jgi:hypothetical protein
MATYDNLDLVRTSIEYRNIANTVNPDYNYVTRTFSFADVELLDGIPAQDQLEIERIFPVNTLGSSKYEGVQLTIADRRLMFKLPKQWFTVDIINKTITIKDIANATSDEYVPAPAASTGPYYDINLGTSRTFKLLAAATPPGENETIIIPGLDEGDDIIIRRRTVSTEKVVNFAPGSRLTSGQLNLQVSQLVNLIQELMWKVDQEFILKFDESAIDGPFLGNKDLDMGTFSIINMGMPGFEGDFFPPSAKTEPEDADRVGRAAVNKYFLEQVFIPYLSDETLVNWNYANFPASFTAMKFAEIDSNLTNKQPLAANLTTLASTATGNVSNLITIGSQANTALVAAIAALAAGTNGFIKKNGAGTVTIDTNTYLTGNQSISLSGAVSGSGTTSISTTLATNAVGTSNINNLAVTNDKIADGTIANAKLANNKISNVALGGNLFTLTRGSYLTGNDYNGSAAQTFAVDAATANTANKVVARDAGGNFAAGTITAALSGNATTATTLQTARTIGLIGGATGTATSFNGSADISINVTALDANTINTGTLSVDRLGSDAIADAKLTNTGAAAGTYANAGFNIPEITVTNKGRITGIVNRDLASSLVTNIQSNAIYWDSTNNTFVALRNSSNQTIRGVADPVLSNDAANKQWSVGQFLGLSATNYDAKNKKIVNVADPVNTYDAVNLNTLAGYSLYGGGQAVPQSIALTFGSPVQTNQSGFDRYEFTVNTLVGENPELMILTDSSNRTYRPSANSADIGNQKFWISTGANKILQVWLTTGTSVSGLTATLRNFGVSRVLTSNVASQTALGFVRVPANGGIDINNGDISLAEATSSVLGGVKIAANNGLALTSGTLSVVRSNAVDQTDSNTLATSTAVKTAYDAAVAAQGTANAALPLTGGTVTGALNVNGAVVLGDANTDTLTITGTAVSTPNGLNFDSNTLVVDATNNRVGIGTASPSSSLHIKTASPGSATGLRIENGSTYVAIEQQNSSYTHFYTSAPKYYFDKNVELGDGILSSYSTTDLQLKTNATTRIRAFNSTGNILIGTGTTDPAVKLYVDGEIKAKTSLILNGSTSGTSTIVAQATAGTTTFTLPSTTGTLIGSNDVSTVSNNMLGGSITDGKLNTIATANKVAISALDIDGGTDIGADLADADLIIVDDGGAGANRKAAVTRIAPYVFSKVKGDISIASDGTTTIATNSVTLGTDTTGNYVATIGGTTNQVIVTGSGSESAAVTLSLPQDIHTTADPTFAGATLGNTKVGITADNEIDTSTGNLILDSAGGTVQVDDNLSVAGDLTLTGNSAKIKLLGSSNNDGLSIERLSAAAGDGAIGDAVLRLTPAGAEIARLFYLRDATATPTLQNEIVTREDLTTAVSGVDISGKMDVAGNTLGSGNQVLGTSTGNSGSFKIQTNGNDNLVLTPTKNAFFRNAQTLDLVGTDHCYLAFKPRGETEGRKAYIGFAAANSTGLVISNEDTGNIALIAGQTGLTVENGGAVKIPKLNNTFRNLTTSFTETVTITDFAQGETRYYAYKLASTSGTDYNFAFVISQTNPTTTAFTVKVDVIPEGSTAVTWNNSTGYTLQNLNYAVAAGVSLNYGLDGVQVLGQTLVLVNDGAYTASPFVIRTTFDNATWRKWMRIEVTRIF